MRDIAEERLHALAAQGYSILVDVQTDAPRVAASSFDPPWTTDTLQLSIAEPVLERATALAALTGADDAANETLLAIFHDDTRIAALNKHDDVLEAEEDLRDAKAALIVLADTMEPSTIPSLDAKEIAYLKLVADGQSDAEAAETLSLSLRAIKERKKRTLTDLRAGSIAHAIRLATASQQI